MFTGVVFGLVMYSVASFGVCDFVVEAVVWIYWLVGLCYCCALVLARFVVRGFFCVLVVVFDFVW